MALLTELAPAAAFRKSAPPNHQSADQKRAPMAHDSRSPLELKAWSFSGAWCLALLVCPAANAQSYSIDWFTIDGGGGTSTGGVYSVSGTIGQPDAGHMAGANYAIDGGFWGLISAVQTPGSPLLTVARTT